jgi:hypothetical protein
MSGRDAFFLILFLFFLLAIGLRLRGAPVLVDLGRRSVDETLGAPGEGPHAAHVAGIAVVDLVVSIAFAAAYAWISKGSFIAWLILVLLAGEIVHGAYGIPTTTYVWLFGHPVRE